jgi:hypothetical protein
MRGFYVVLTIATLTAPAPVSLAGAAEARTADTSRSIAVSPLPDDAYPPHTKLTYYPRWSNHDFDCTFGWYCDGASPLPFVHILTEDQLHRTGGWALWGEWHGDALGFELYPSTYADGIAQDGMAHPIMTWNQAAATDEQTILVRVQGAQAVTPVPQVLPAGVAGGAFAYDLTMPYGHILFLTAWCGRTQEVEAAVLYPMNKQAEARHYLSRQVRSAIRLTQENV